MLPIKVKSKLATINQLIILYILAITWVLTDYKANPNDIMVKYFPLWCGRTERYSLLKATMQELVGTFDPHLGILSPFLACPLSSPRCILFLAAHKSLAFLFLFLSSPPMQLLRSQAALPYQLSLTPIKLASSSLPCPFLAFALFCFVNKTNDCREDSASPSSWHHSAGQCFSS